MECSFSTFHWIIKTKKGYRVFVGPETYEEYEVGYVYTDTTCDIEDYAAIQDVINELLTWGIIEGIS